jgi:hypothetical protein
MGRTAPNIRIIVHSMRARFALRLLAGRVFLTSSLATILLLVLAVDLPSSIGLEGVDEPTTLSRDREDVKASNDRDKQEVWDIVRFRFLHPTAVRRSSSDDRITLPESEFGELLYDSRTGRAVYRFWYDGVHERAALGRGNPWREPDRFSQEDYRSVLKAVAVYDGKAYWVVKFSDDHLNNRADGLFATVYPDMKVLDEQEEKVGLIGDHPKWYATAPLHMLMKTISATNLNRENVAAALETCVFAKKGIHGAYDVVPRNDDRGNISVVWGYSISMDQSTVGIAEIGVRYQSPFIGRWAYAYPARYVVRRSVDADNDSNRLEIALKLESYISTRTEMKRF